MELLEIAGTRYSPYIKMDPVAQEIVIAGVSRPENTVEFFTPVLKWLNDYLDASRVGERRKVTTLRLCLSYFNSISAKYILSIILKCKQLCAGGEELVVEWGYDPEDEDSREWGEDMAGIAGLDFTFKARSDFA